MLGVGDKGQTYFFKSTRDKTHFLGSTRDIGISYIRQVTQLPPVWGPIDGSLCLYMGSQIFGRVTASLLRGKQRVTVSLFRHIRT